MLFYSYFKTLVGQEVTVELKNDLAITGEKWRKRERREKERREESGGRLMGTPTSTSLLSIHPHPVSSLFPSLRPPPLRRPVPQHQAGRRPPAGPRGREPRTGFRAERLHPRVCCPVRPFTSRRRGHGAAPRRDAAGGAGARVREGEGWSGTVSSVLKKGGALFVCFSSFRTPSPSAPLSLCPPNARGRRPNQTPEVGRALPGRTDGGREQAPRSGLPLPPFYLNLVSLSPFRTLSPSFRTAGRGMMNRRRVHLA